MFRNALISILLLFALTSKLVGQELTIVRSDSVAKIEGEEYLIHSVLSKQTLFSIAKVYGVKISTIVFENPNVLDGIQPGQYLKILKSSLEETSIKQDVQPELKIDGEFVLYKVPAKKTLYSISKEYETTISAILDANPEMTDGLKVGMTLRIPVQKLMGNTKYAKVEMVGLPDMVIPNKKFFQSRRLRVLVLLPFYLEMNTRTEGRSGVNGQMDTIAIHQTKEDQEQIYKKSEMALHFYEGLLMGVDSLSKLGYDIELEVLDTENRPWKVQQLIKKGRFKGLDLIIGPFYSKVFEQAAQYADLNCIPIISPTIKSQGIIKENPFVFKMIPSAESMVFEMGRYISRSDSTNNLILHYGREDEKHLLWKFRQGLEADGIPKAGFPSYDIYKMGKDSIRLQLSLIDRNNVIVLSENQISLNSLVRNLSDWSEDAYIVGFAPNSWSKFRSLDVDHYDRLRLHMPVPFFVDHERIEVQYFVKEFRERYKTEPSTFAFRGFDLTMHFIPHLDGIERNGPEHMLSIQENGLQSNFRWKRVREGGFENFGSSIVDHTDLRLKPATD